MLTMHIVILTVKHKTHHIAVCWHTERRTSYITKMVTLLTKYQTTEKNKELFLPEGGDLDDRHLRPTERRRSVNAAANVHGFCNSSIIICQASPNNSKSVGHFLSLRPKSPTLVWDQKFN